MLIAEIVLAFVLAFGFAYAFALLFGRPGPWGSAWTTGLIAFLFILGFGLLLEPFGPAFYGVFFLPFLLVAAVVMLLFVAIPPRPAPPAPPASPVEPTTEGSVTGDLALGATFWVMVVALLAVAFFGVAAGAEAIV